MKSALLGLCLMVVTFLCLILQYYIPPLAGFDQARVSLVPIIFCYGAMALPFPFMLALAVFTGLLYDLSLLQVVDGRVEIALGWSICFFVVMGTVCQGLRHDFLRGKWWLHTMMSFFCVLFLLAGQFAMISLRRMQDGGLLWDEVVIWRILAPAVLAFLLAPFIYFVMFYWERLVSGPTRRPLRSNA